MGLEQSEQGRSGRAGTERYQGHYRDAGRHSKHSTAHGLGTGLPFHTSLIPPVSEKLHHARGGQYRGASFSSPPQQPPQWYPHSAGSVSFLPTYRGAKEAWQSVLPTASHALVEGEGVVDADSGLKGSTAGPALRENEFRDGGKA